MTLLECLRSREQAAWSRMLHLYAPLVRAWCHHHGVVGADADDVAQDVFQAVATGLDQFQKTRPGDTFRGWLRGITRHKLVDFFRRRSTQPQAAGGTAAGQQMQQVPQPEVTLPEETPEQVAGLYQRALDLVQSEFEENTWRAFWRTAVDGQPPADIAAELGMSAPAVRMAKSRVLHRLKREIGDLQ
ncbi:MAG: sigma-70 family RNA polymerase sigma factor [Gemmataceae bacterium]|nr:sigma-70 family RNA polymerase sigma factor [Gemmataceae bacterium]